MPSALPASIIFDLDGTLVDSAPDLHACCNQLLAELDLAPLGLETVTSFIGEGIPPLIERCLAAAGRVMPGPDLEGAIGRYKQIYAAAPARHSRPYAGVVDCLGQLHGHGVRLGICTNKSEPLANKVLDALDLGRFFSVVVGGDTLTTRKPDPAPLLHAAGLLQAGSTASTVYVGDSEIDAAAAAAARMPFVLFTRGYRKAATQSLPHDAVFDDFATLVATLRQVRG